MNLSDEIWFSHQPKIGDNCPTIGQFLHSISYRSDLTDEEKKDYALAHLKDDAQRWSRKAAKLDWNAFKYAIAAKFNVSLKITEKVELRRNLCQDIGETCRGFLDRCIMTQFLICDDDEELVVERDILISFLLGLRPELYEALILVDNLTTLDSYFTMAAKLELDFIVEDVKKEEDIIFPFQSDIFERGDDDFGHKSDYENDDHIMDPHIVDLELHQEKCAYKQEVEEGNDIKCEDFHAKNEDEEVKAPKRKRKKVSLQSWNFNGAKSDDSDDSSFNPEDDPDYDCNKPLLPKWECKLCGLKYKLRVKLSMHMKAQHKADEDKKDSLAEGAEGKTKKCVLCGLLCKSSRVLRKHMDYAHPNEALICCGRDFTSKGKLAFFIHKNCKHGKRGPDNTINCDLCERSGMSKNLLYKHYMKDHFNTDPFVCPHCDWSFVQNHELRRHIKVKHNKELNFQCDKCEEKLLTNGHLRRHLKSVHGIGQDYFCEECGKAFPHAESLYSHKKAIHSGICRKPVVCEECGFISSSRSALKDHILARHTEEKPYECPREDCDRRYASNKRVNAHLRTAHSEKKKAFKCSQCGKAFNNNKTLKKHNENVHLNLKKYQCDKCDFASAYVSVFSDHVKVMHENVIFGCNFDGCKFVAKYQRNLTKHLKVAHQVPMPSEVRELERQANIAEKKARLSKINLSDGINPNLK